MTKAVGRMPVAASPVEPHVFHAPAIVLAVDHDGQPLQLGLPAGRGAEMIDDWPRPVLLQFLVDFPDQLAALLLVSFRRLLDELPFDLGVALAAVIALRAAAIILIELLVWVVNAAAGIVLADLVILARHLGKPVGGFAWLLFSDRH